MNTELHPQVLQSLTENDIKYTVFACDPELADTYAFCEKYGFDLSQSANTIIVASKSEPIHYACCVVLANTKLDVNKKVAELMGVKRLSFATAEQTTALTEMMIGGVVAIGITGIPIYIDSAVFTNTEIVMGGGNRSTKILLDPHELKKLTNAQIIEDLAKPKDIVTS